MRESTIVADVRGMWGRGWQIPEIAEWLHVSEDAVTHIIIHGTGPRAETDWGPPSPDGDTP